MGRSAGSDSGRSVFVGAPLWGGYRESCGSWPEDWLSSRDLGAWRNRSGDERGVGSADWFERLGAERAQGVETAPGELAGDRDRGSGVREPARLEREVVGA